MNWKSILKYVLISLGVVILSLGIPGIIGVISGCSTTNYIDEVVNCSSAIGTIILGLCTYELSKKVGLVELENKAMKTALGAYRIVRTIKHMSNVIYKISKNINSATKLKINKYYMEDIVYLKVTNVINSDEFLVLEEFQTQVEAVEKEYQNSSTSNEAVRNFVNQYLKEANGNMEYKNELKKIIDKLDRHIGEE